MRLWSGSKNDAESLYELVGDRIIFMQMVSIEVLGLFTITIKMEIAI